MLPNRVWFDLETHPFGPGLQAPPIVCSSVATFHPYPLPVTLDAPEELHQYARIGVGVERVGAMAPLFRSWIEDPGIVLSNLNIAFDLACWCAHDPAFVPLIFQAYAMGRIESPDVKAKLIDLEAGELRGWCRVRGQNTKIGYGADDLALRYLDRELDKKNPWRARYRELEHLDVKVWPREALLYSLEDARFARDLDYALASYQPPNYHAECAHDFWLKLMSVWGIRTDAVAIEHFRSSTQRALDDCLGILVEHGLATPGRTTRTGSYVPPKRNIKVAQERVREVYERQGLPVPETDKGQVSTDVDACKKSGDKALLALSDYSSLQVVVSRNVPELLEGVKAPIHARFESLKESGRTGCKEPNLQNRNTDEGDRECFVPSRPGWCFVSADFSGLELYTLAQVLYSLIGRSTLGETLKAGKDPHCVLASALSHQPYEWCVENAEKGLPGYYFRQTAKVGNFGIPGGLGAEMLVAYAYALYGIELTIEEARALKRTYLQTHPEMRDYFALISRWVEQKRPIEQLFSGRLRGGCKYTDGCNTLFQGLGADIAKSAGWNISRACYAEPASPLYGWRVVNFVHDEFILEGPTDRCHEAGEELSRLMRTTADLWLPNVPGIKAKPVASWRWSKRARPAYEGGRLVPYDVRHWAPSKPGDVPPLVLQLPRPYQ